MLLVTKNKNADLYFILFYFIVVYLSPINKYVNTKLFLSCDFFASRKHLLFFRAVLE